MSIPNLLCLPLRPLLPCVTTCSLLLPFACLLHPFNLHALEVLDADLCVYGGTSGGVIAAVQSARMGKSVTLVAVNGHLGGMTSGGLGATDIGAFGDSYIQGVAREFYRRVGQKYGVGIRFNFEPRVAEAVFEEMAAEAGVRICRNQYAQSVILENASLTAITLNTGNILRARTFIDASYEGDLMALAGVSYTVGRESASQYGESLNGVLSPAASGHQFGNIRVDPYIIPNNPASGLLPLMQTGALQNIGSADHHVQAYNFRLCLTQNTTNRLPITSPPGYDPAQYELLARYIQALQAQGASPTLASFMNIYSMPNGKTDINNNGPVSTDFIGQSDAYPEADPATRAQIRQAHKNYVQGFLHFLARDPRVPASVQSQMQSYGLCKDEFSDTENWPRELYVRETRRMISDYVLTQSNCLSLRTVSDPIGLGAYAMDSHHCQRLVVDGAAQNEGEFYFAGAIPRPYPIPYRTIVPPLDQCRNLLVPWCLSASHVAFGSFRMEPVFMIISQSAATAACLALDDNLPVQQLDYAKLRLQLIADGQALGDDGQSQSGVVVDNTDPTGMSITGTWTASTSVSGFVGDNYLHDGNTGKGAKSVRFTPNLPSSGNYHVYLRWTADPNRADTVPVEIFHSGGSSSFICNQKINGAQWVYLGTFPFAAGTAGSLRIHTTATTGYVIADAARFLHTDTLPVVNLVATDAGAGEWHTNSGRVTSVRSGDTNSPLPIQFTLAGTAQSQFDFIPVSGSLIIPSGALAASLEIHPRADDLVEGPETVVLTLAPSAQYSPGALSNATVLISDRPLAQWQMNHFTGDQLADPNSCGDNADPDRDGIPNLAEYTFGLDPTIPSTNTPPAVSIRNSQFTFTYPVARTAIDVAPEIQSSTNLIHWNSASELLHHSIIDADGTRATHVATEILPSTNSPRHFFRFRFTHQ